MAARRELSVRGTPIHMLQELFADEVMPHFREDAHVDETAGVRR